MQTLRYKYLQPFEVTSNRIFRLLSLY